MPLVGTAAYREVRGSRADCGTDGRGRPQTAIQWLPIEVGAQLGGHVVV